MGTSSKTRLEIVVIPKYNSGGEIVGFIVQDPEEKIICRRATLIGYLHQEYPRVSLRELDDASIAYDEGSAEVSLRR